MTVGGQIAMTGHPAQMDSWAGDTSYLVTGGIEIGSDAGEEGAVWNGEWRIIAEFNIHYFLIYSTILGMSDEKTRQKSLYKYLI